LVLFVAGTTDTRWCGVHLDIMPYTVDVVAEWLTKYLAVSGIFISIDV